MRFLHGAASRFGVFALSVVVLLVLVAPGWAQVSTGTILGIVKDASGASVADATVTITNTETNQARTITSESDGAFNAPALPVGRYSVKIEKSGFQSFVQQGIVLVVSQELVVNATLEVGASNQQVVVTSEAPLVNTTTAQVSGLVDEQTVKELPLNGRSYDNLITLNTGAVNFTAIHPANTTQGGFGHLFSVSGRRPDANLFLLNGVQYGGTGLQTDLPGSVSQQLLGIDAVREFNVLSENYSAEYGKRTGGQILIVTNSGTNTIHGSVFDFERNSALDSRNPFDNQTKKIPHFTRHNFGASFGAPIRKDKTFIFGNYEGLRQDLGLSNIAFVPDTALLTTGILPCAPAGVGDCPAGGSVTVSSAVAPYLNLYPKQNGAELGGGLAQFFSSPAQTISEHFGTVRLDQIIGSKDTLSGVYTIDSGVSSTPDVTNTTITLFQLRTQVVSISDTHVFSPNVLNTGTIGFSRANFSQSPSTTIPASFAFIQNYQMGVIVVGNGGGAGGSSTISRIGTTAASNDARNIYTLADNVQVTKGIHQLALGVLFQRVDDNENEIGAAGTASFNDMVGFVTGTLGSFQGAPVFTPLSWRTYEGAWFVSDSIKVRRNLTLTVGLRHEFTNGWNEVYGRSSRYEFGTNNILQTVPRISSSEFNTNNGLLLFSPRVGVAWDPFGDGKTSVQAGFGIYYNVMDTLGQLSSVNAPFNGNEIITGTNTPGTFPFPLQTPTTTLASPSPVQYDGNLQTPALVAYNVKIQRQVLPSLAVTIGFNGNHGTHNVSFEDKNTVTPLVCSAAITSCANGVIEAYNPTTGLVQAIPAPIPNGTLFYPTCTAGVIVPNSTSLNLCPRRNPALGSSKLGESEANSWYTAGTIEIVERARGGFTFKTNYTYSKATDDATSTLVFQGSTNNVLNIENIASEWGPSQFDIRNRFSFSGTYALPFGKGKTFGGNSGDLANRVIGGWELNTIITVQSGSPFNPFLGFDQSRNGNTNQPDRPDVNPLFTGNPYPHTVKQWYNPQQFALPPAGTYGNAVRNSLVGPPLRDVDLSLSKSTLITERLSAQFRAEAFNIFNHWNLGVPNTTVLNTGGAPLTTAGAITTTATTSRQLQFGLKLIW